MPDNDAQKAVEKSLKRIANQTPNDIRERLNESIIGFQNRTDIIRATAQQNPATGAGAKGTQPASVTVSETVIPVTSITLNKGNSGDSFAPSPAQPATIDLTVVIDGVALTKTFLIR